MPSNYKPSLSAFLDFSNYIVRIGMSLKMADNKLIPGPQAEGGRIRKSRRYHLAFGMHSRLYILSFKAGSNLEVVS